MKTYFKLSLIILLVFFNTMFPSNVFAKNNIGTGFILGSPSALLITILPNKYNAIDIGLGEISDDLYIFGDYNKNIHNVFPINELYLQIGIGIGFHDFESENKVKNEDESRFEIRLPFGIEYLFNKAPIAIFLELVPSLQIIPDVSFNLRGGLGARYYF